MDDPNNIELNADTGGSEQARSRKIPKHAVKEMSSIPASAEGNDAASSRKGNVKPVLAKPNRRGQGKTKKERLIALLSKPNEARVSMIVERLGWQGHTVRAALSGLRKQGFSIAVSKSARTGETVYAITTAPVTDAAKTGETSV